MKWREKVALLRRGHPLQHRNDYYRLKDGKVMVTFWWPIYHDTWKEVTMVLLFSEIKGMLLDPSVS